ncbi:aminofutalosine deaminase family hydrolase [Candidatus Sulfurimonas baltica]|uniref:Metal-dependent hydrolase n=1 Tax=Candidatus Sulfurimonas baltica TaxID=2740404 RepID=A0A7S7LTT6_9BACT|nr:metal-dependent hydrolase [Candidatus Sulfurimonas baltica]QOY51263.1 metal-dependent hydrolase [Candidatus Sulfurimonas baltica]
MQIIVPNYILTPNKLLSNMSVAFDKTIKKIAPLNELKEEFPDAEITILKENSLLMPGLINAHVHVEFSANKTNLSYGDFISWLYSVIENREELIDGCKNDCMVKAIDSMLESGITTFGAISSHGMDLEACQNAPQNVVFFNELIGSQATMADALFGDFLARLDASKSVKREGFYPAVAIHSPYSVHPVLIKKALGIVKNEKLKLTAHFMESKAEREWLDNSDGDFKDFFKNLLNQNSAISDSHEFLEYFDGQKTLLTHAVKAEDKELNNISSNGHTVIHCPISNRLLGNGALDLAKLDKLNINWITATDGLSSNYKLDLFEEMKIALFMHTDMPLLELAKKLINSVTKGAALALGLNTGEISQGKNADMIVLDLDNEPNDELAIHLILHRYNVSKIYINGKLKKGI